MGLPRWCYGKLMWLRIALSHGIINSARDMNDNERKIYDWG